MVTVLIRVEISTTRLLREPEYDTRGRALCVHGRWMLPRTVNLRVSVQIAYHQCHT